MFFGSDQPKCKTVLGTLGTPDEEDRNNSVMDPRVRIGLGEANTRHENKFIDLERQLEILQM